MKTLNQFIKACKIDILDHWEYTEDREEIQNRINGMIRAACIAYGGTHKPLIRKEFAQAYREGLAKKIANMI